MDTNVKSGSQDGYGEYVQVNTDRSLMGGSDWVIWVVGTLGTANNVSPPRTDLSTSGNVDDRIILVGDTSVASEVAIVYVLDGVV